MAKAPPIYTLSITHQHGVELSLYTSEQAATLGLYAYVHTWWTTTFAGEQFRPFEPRMQEAIDAYFAHMPGEDYTITPYPVEDLETVMQTQFPDAAGEWLWFEKLEDEKEECAHDHH